MPWVKSRLMWWRGVHVKKSWTTNIEARERWYLDYNRRERRPPTPNTPKLAATSRSIERCKYEKKERQ